MTRTKTADTAETPAPAVPDTDTAPGTASAYEAFRARPLHMDDIEALVARGRRMRAEYLHAMLLTAGRGLAGLFRAPRRAAPDPALVAETATSALSHDLRTPLTAIRSCSELLIDHPDMPGDHRTRFLGSIHEEALRLEHKIDSLLRLAETEPGGLAERLAAALRRPSAPAGAH